MSRGSPDPPEAVDEDPPSAATLMLASWLAELEELDLSEWEPFSPPPVEETE